jgi:hypothetical protein
LKLSQNAFWIGLPGSDVMQANPTIGRPSQHGPRNHFRPVIQNDRLGVAAHGGDRVKGARHAHAGERRVGLERQILARAIVADD